MGNFKGKREKVERMKRWQAVVQKVRRRMVAEDISGRELARRVGVSEASIGRALSVDEHTAPAPKTIAAILTTLDIEEET